MDIIKRHQTYILFFLLLFICTGFVQAQDFYCQVDDEEIVVSIFVPQGSDYRVWHNTNPMKIIIDLDYTLKPSPPSKTVNDSVLNEIRISAGPNGSGTRIVLDFAYLVPEYDWVMEGDWLTVTVYKVYVKSSIQTISYGVRFGQERRGIPAGPLIVNYLEVRYGDPLVEIKSVLAQDQIFGKELVSDMAARSQAIAAVNGLFFASDGRPLGLLVLDGRLISEPYANRTAIGIKPGEIGMAPVGLHGSIMNQEGDEFVVSGLNRPRLADELIVYTSDYGSDSRTNAFGTDLTVVDGVVVHKSFGAAEIPGNGVVVSGHGLARDFLNKIEIGDQLQVILDLDPDWLGAGYQYVIGGGPRLVENGRVYITAELERFQADVADSRAPRTALGITADKKLLLVTVNGRKPGISVGVTLQELAELMIDLGAVDAMNLDGGGSTTMVIRNQVLNLPSDGVERMVTNGIVITTPESRK